MKRVKKIIQQSTYIYADGKPVPKAKPKPTVKSDKAFQEAARSSKAQLAPLFKRLAKT